MAACMEDEDWGEEIDRKRAAKEEEAKQVVRTGRHDEYDELIQYSPKKLRNPKDQEYYDTCKNDLRLVLLVNKGGVNVADIRREFKILAEYSVDLRRLQLKNWIQFLLSCRRILNFKVDRRPSSNRNTVYVFLNEFGKCEIHSTTEDMQSMINCTPDDKESPKAMYLAPIDVMEAFVQGFLNPIDGFSGRYSNDDGRYLTKQQKSKKARGPKLSFEEQVAKANKPRALNTPEAMAPLPGTQTGSVEACMAMMDQFDELELLEKYKPLQQYKELC